MAFSIKTTSADAPFNFFLNENKGLVPSIKININRLDKKSNSSRIIPSPQTSLSNS
jgi:hypothetical protein